MVAYRTPTYIAFISGVDTAILDQFDHTAALVAQLRTVRKAQNISFKEPLDLVETTQDNISLRPIVEKLVNIQTWDTSAKAPEQAISFRVNAHEYFVPVTASNIEEERNKMEEELAYQEGFLRSVEKKLTNERFVSNAPEQVVAIERKKAEDAQTKIAALKARLSAL